VEIKTREGATGAGRHERLARNVSRLVKKMKLEEQIFVLSFDPVVLAAATDEVAGLRTVLNLKPPRRLTKTLADRLDMLHALSVDVRTLTHAFAVALQVWNKPLYVYTCNTPKSASRALDAGAAGVMSDRPAWLAEQFQREPTADSDNR
jgi:glycerophosphoryl diester phosphodiesterase